ncbi:MAG TPA: hypothetical protein ENH62_06115 [Marinobacter sp.]|uniref:Uncharacterized protein n=1 Tax=marine sediment metagenome TaxID=412755 RepID=A0A0F9RFH6_9ZZZZ|nr:hypothetical protein [Marinobacter sp.]
MAHLSREELQDARAREQQRAISGGVGRGSGPGLSRGLDALARAIGSLTIEGGGRGPGVLPLQKPAPSAIPANQAVADARKKQRAEALRRKGRRSTILSGGAGVIGEAPLSQPQALGG